MNSAYNRKWSICDWCKDASFSARRPHLGELFAGGRLEMDKLQGDVQMITDRLPSAANALRDSPIPHLRSLDIDETDHEIVMRGQVSSYYEKQLAQEAVMPHVGKKRLKNLLIVSEYERRSLRP